jgi:DnaJ-class molecular chaperone
MSDIFEGLFGGARGGGFSAGFGRRVPEKGANVAYRLAVPFVDAATLAPQRVQLPGGAIEIKLPAGLESGTQMRLAGKGETGPGGPGDALVTIEVEPHRFFSRDGDDIRLDLPISIREAVLGGQVKVPTVDKPVMLTIPKGTSSGRTLRLKGKGWPKKGGERGDQLVTLQVVVPANDAELERFVADWAGAEGNPRAALGV